MDEYEDARYQLYREIIAVPEEERPCAAFSESEHDANECKHCGWTLDAHILYDELPTMD